MYPEADCDTDHQLLVVTLRVRLSKRQRQHNFLPLNLEELKEEKAVQIAAEVTNRFTALEAAQNEVTLEDFWKGIKTVLLEVARETIRSVKSQKKKKWISDETYRAIREKREAKGFPGIEKKDGDSRLSSLVNIPSLHHFVRGCSCHPSGSKSQSHRS